MITLKICFVNKTIYIKCYNTDSTQYKTTYFYARRCFLGWRKLYQILTERTGNLELNTNNIQRFTPNEQKYCATYQELNGIVYAFNKYQVIKNGKYLVADFRNGHNATFGCLKNKEQLLNYFL